MNIKLSGIVGKPESRYTPDGRVNSYQHRVQFYIAQCCRYSSRHMEEWNDGLPLKTKARFV